MIKCSFSYFPNAFDSESIKNTDQKCICCGRHTGYVYTGPVYSKEEFDDCFCPWCIHDGSVAEKYGATFSDDHPLHHANLSQEIIDEVTKRTPGFESWQQEEWKSHCDDACEFHGDATKDDILNVAIETKKQWFLSYETNEETWNLTTEGYLSGGAIGFYKFKCRKCGLIILGWDCT